MLQVSNYQKEAADLLTSFGVKFSANFIKHDFYFQDDKEQRDIYRITFSRNGQKYERFSLRFGQSIANAGTAPTEYDVLACITKYDVGTFENFCGDFGYDVDSRKAEKTYKAVCREFAKVSAFFSPSELEAIQEIN